MQPITKKLRLTGGRKGQTVVLSGFRFVDGCLTLTGDPTALDKTAHYLNVYYQTEEVCDGEPDPAPAADAGAPAAVGGRVEPAGEGSDKVPAEDGGGHDAADASQPGLRADGHGSKDARILEALKQLDPTDDDHWTTSGLPAVFAVSGILGEAVTRADIDAVAANFRR